MYRYRFQGHVSRNVLTSFFKHRDKLGTITKVVAKRYRATRKSNGYIDTSGATATWTPPSTYTTTYEVVTVYGTTGSARFTGVCWGYGGEGPRAVFALLRSIGLPIDVASYFAFKSKRGQYNEVGTDWTINLTPTTKSTTTKQRRRPVDKFVRGRWFDTVDTVDTGVTTPTHAESKVA